MEEMATGLGENEEAIQSAVSELVAVGLLQYGVGDGEVCIAERWRR